MTVNAAESNTILPLSFDHISYRVNDLRLLKDISLTLPADKSVTIVGPNGAGKTLLLRVAHGLLMPGDGEVHWNQPLEAKRAGVQAMVSQRPVMLKRSVKDNMLFFMQACGVPKDAQMLRMESSLEQANLLRFLNRPARKLSGGEQQRLALARCLALKPAILYLDEPTAHLDPASTTQVENLVLTIRESGCQTVMVTHDLAQARRLGEFSVFMQGGRVVEAAETEKFFTRPESEALTVFLKGQLFR